MFRYLAPLFLCLTLAADPIAAGKYSGKWEGASGASGEFRMTLGGLADHMRRDLNAVAIP